LIDCILLWLIVKMNTKKALIIFTRNPELGKCKTRLAKTVGNESALAIYKFLLDHTVSITKNLSVDKFVYYSNEITENDIWDSTIYNKQVQTGNDLGEKMNNAFSEVFQKGYTHAIVIGSDMYDLSQTDLETAFQAFNENNYVIGPAEDGGYYLIGMKTATPQLFKNKNWGTGTVLADTLKDLEKLNYNLLDERNDVDYYEDIKDIEAFKPMLTSIKYK